MIIIQFGAFFNIFLSKNEIIDVYKPPPYGLHFFCGTSSADWRVRPAVIFIKKNVCFLLELRRFF